MSVALYTHVGRSSDWTGHLSGRLLYQDLTGFGSFPGTSSHLSDLKRIKEWLDMKECNVLTLCILMDSSFWFDTMNLK